MHKSGGSPHVKAVLRQYELIERVRSYDPDADEGLINRAYVFSMKAHGSQVRASGDLDRVREIGVARSAELRAVRLHREDVGAVDQSLVRVGIVGPDLLDQFILPQHTAKMGSSRFIVQARKGGAARVEESGGPGETG